MKLGAAYNVFTGEELLPFSLKTIRKHVDHITIVYSTVSFRGEAAEPGLVPLLEALKTQGLVDELYEYKSNPAKTVLEMETECRDIGLQFSKQAGCTHHLTMDVDEFYIEKQFVAAKTFIEQNMIGCSACEQINYLTPQHQIEQMEQLGYHPFISAISPTTTVEYDTYFPVSTDAARRISGLKKFYFFPRTALVLHHMIFVRRDILKKYRNYTLFPAEEHQSLLANVFAWRPDQPFRFHDCAPECEVIEVENLFGIIL